MMLLIFEVSRTGQATTSIAKVWVNADDADLAMEMATRKVTAEGYAIQSLVECTATEKSDYFPPCKSLDAFEQALSEGVCTLYS